MAKPPSSEIFFLVRKNISEDGGLAIEINQKIEING
jgi:hypothetical protein